MAVANEWSTRRTAMKTFEILSFQDFVYLGKAQLSEDQKKLFYLSAKMNLEKNSYDRQLRCYDFESQEDHFFSKEKIGSFYALDGQSIWLTAEREEQAKRPSPSLTSQLYQLPMNGGEAEFISLLPFQPSKHLRVDELRHLFLGSWAPVKADPEKLTDPLEKMVAEAEVKVIEETPFWMNGSGFLEKSRSRLFLWNEKTHEVNILTPETLDVEDFDFDTKTGEILYVARPFDQVASIYNKLFLQKIGGEAKELRQAQNYSYNYAAFLNEGSVVFIGSDMSLMGINQDDDIYLLHRKNGREKRISPDHWEASLWNSVGSDARYLSGSTRQVEKGKLYFVSTEFDNSYLNVIDAQGELQRVSQVPGSVDSFVVRGDRIVAVSMRNRKLQELYLMGKDGEVQLTFHNQAVDDYERAKIESFDFHNGDTPLKAYVLFPKDYDSEKKYPAILTIHGGPKTAFGDLFFHEMEVLAAAGYFVFYTNPRGSDGRGRAFSDIRGKYGTIDYEDLMTCVDEVLRRYPSIDSHRLGVTGGSYGGFMVNWMIGHTDRFAAACSQRSIANWIAKYGLTDIGYYFVPDQNQATPWENFDHLWEKSPLKHVQAARTPTLFIHSDEDHRCHYSCAMQMHTALQLQAVETRFVLFHGENHELSRSGKPKQRVRRLYELLNWFEKYLKEKN